MKANLSCLLMGAALVGAVTPAPADVSPNAARQFGNAIADVAGKAMPSPALLLRE